jgi:hypothetical protein
MHNVDLISLTVTFLDGTRRRITLNPDDLDYFQSDMLSDLLNLDSCPRDLSSVGLENLK